MTPQQETTVLAGSAVGGSGGAKPPSLNDASQREGSVSSLASISKSERQREGSVSSLRSISKLERQREGSVSSLASMSKSERQREGRVSLQAHRSHPERPLTLSRSWLQGPRQAHGTRLGVHAVVCALGASAVSAVLLAAPSARASDAPGLPLPDAPVRLHIADVAAFDAALTGRFREALAGTLDTGDPVATAWRQTQVGSKLEAQWSRFAGDLPWTWGQVRRLQPRSLALALLDVGQLEAVLVIDTPLAALPDPLPAGEARAHNGAAYRLVAPGAADGSSDSERRMGFAYARSGGYLILATSARALELALDADQQGRRFDAPLPGLIGLDLDLDALRKDRYFQREFLFGAGPESGHVRAALRLEQGRLVELRAGSGPAQPAASTFEWRGAAAAGWEPDGAGLARALRAGLLEPLALLTDKPVPALGALPPVQAGSAEDPYLVSLERPVTSAGSPAYEEGELADWRALFARQPVDGWGFAVDADGTRRLVFAWPEARQAELETLCRRTLERRAGRARVVAVAGAREVQVGPGLPALALKRTGAFVWLGSSATALADAPTPQPGGDLVRWGHTDLDTVRREGARWNRIEGAAAPERVRPFSDRILGLLGWIPETHTLSVERRRTSTGWTERVVF